MTPKTHVLNENRKMLERNVMCFVWLVSEGRRRVQREIKVAIVVGIFYFSRVFTAQCNAVFAFI